MAPTQKLHNAIEITYHLDFHSCWINNKMKSEIWFLRALDATMIMSIHLSSIGGEAHEIMSLIRHNITKYG